MQQTPNGDARQLNDRELLLQVYDDVQWMIQLLDGNGREGLHDMVVRHDERINSLSAGATPRQRSGIVTGIGVGTVALVLTIAKWFGFEVPG